jgi:hypothetical protein
MNLFWMRVLSCAFSVLGWVIVLFTLTRAHPYVMAFPDGGFWIYLLYLITMLVCALTLSVVSFAYVFGRIDLVSGTVESATLTKDGHTIWVNVKLVFPICPGKDVSIDGSRVVLFFVGYRPWFCLKRNFAPDLEGQ